MTWLPVFQKSLVLSYVKQSSVMSHFRVMETSSGTTGEGVSQDLLFCVVAESRQCGAGGGYGRRPCGDARQVRVFAHVQH